jgi:hypothetical protein
MSSIPFSLEALSELAGTRIVSAEPAAGGGNSRVYRITNELGTDFAAKFYLQPTIEGRSRLDVEYEGLSFLWGSGIRRVPRPIAADHKRGIALYEYIHGAPMPGDSIGTGEIAHVVRFAADLRDLRCRPEAADLHDASEACYSVQSLVANIEKRLRRLQSALRSDVQPAAVQYLAHEFVPAFDALKGWTSVRGTGSGHEIAAEVRTLSPSDFGFHNTLRRDDGELVFLDFEYFGWDDPAKMISDFILHPAMQLTERLKALFVTRMVDCFSADETLVSRLVTTYPLYGLKWCMIMLNEFIPKDLTRRTFAAGDAVDVAAAQARQLEKSRVMLRRIMGCFEEFPYLAHVA